MNKQGIIKSGKFISRGIEWTHFPGYRGATANPVRGCEHGCKWKMPDGKVAQCYAKSIVERLATKAYPNGFEEVTFHPEELVAIRKEKQPHAIFIDSMSDLFGIAVKSEWIVEVIKTMYDCPQHVFFTLTKNPRRLLAPMCVFPDNVLVGVSAPPTEMYGKQLTVAQQTTWFSHALHDLAHCDAKNKWVSIEPLSFDVSEVIRQHRDALKWAVVGAASNGAATYQPTPDHFAKTLEALYTVRVFFKGNISKELCEQIGVAWREEFPKL